LTWMHRTESDSGVRHYRHEGSEISRSRRIFVTRWAPAALASAFLAACNIGKNRILVEAINNRTNNNDIWTASPNPDRPQTNGGTIVDQVIQVVAGQIHWLWFTSQSWTGWGFQRWTNGKETIDVTQQGLEDVYLRIDLGPDSRGLFDIVVEDGHRVSFNGSAWIGNEVGMQSDDPRILRGLHYYGRSLLPDNSYVYAPSLFVSLREIQTANPAIDLTNLKQIKFRAKSPTGSADFFAIQIVKKPTDLPTTRAANVQPSDLPGGTHSLNAVRTAIVALPLIGSIAEKSDGPQTPLSRRNFLRGSIGTAIVGFLSRALPFTQSAQAQTGTVPSAPFTIAQNIFRSLDSIASNQR